MNLSVSEEAAKWYESELTIEDYAEIRFFVRYGGVGGNIPGFSLGVKFDTPEEPHVSIKFDKITFFIESADTWYFDGKDLKVTLNQDTDEPDFSYI